MAPAAPCRWTRCLTKSKMPLDSDGVIFVNDFLKKIEEDGTWADLWKISLGDRTGIETVPDAPAIEE